MLEGAKGYIRSTLAKVRQQQREQELKSTRPHVTGERIASDLRAMGIVPGDMLFIHSSLKSLGYVDGGPEAVIQGLLEAVGPEGTLLLPTYYMPAGTILGTCQTEGYVFDPRHHGTSMGALPGAFLGFPGVQRSVHPTHSVSALGRHAKFLTEAHHLAPSVFGTGSPWQRFHECNGKVLGIGISLGPVTFYHLLEDRLGDGFPVRVWEDETYRLPCKGWHGEDHQVPVRPYRPEATACRIDQKSREDLREYFRLDFTHCGILHTGEVASAASWFVSADDFLNRLAQLADQGITIYSSAEELAAAGSAEPGTRHEPGNQG